MYKNILLALDGSELSEMGTKEAVSLAKVCDSKITILQVVELLPALPKVREEEQKVLAARSEEYTGRVKKEIEANGIVVDKLVRIGKPALEICNTAQQSDIDLIVLTTHGLGGFKGWAVGSVSDKVIRHAPKPVLLLRAFPPRPDNSG